MNNKTWRFADLFEAFYFGPSASRRRRMRKRGLPAEGYWYLPIRPLALVSSVPSKLSSFSDLPQDQNSQEIVENELDRKSRTVIERINEVVFYNRMPAHQLRSRE
jgi:hypothetical protein